MGNCKSKKVFVAKETYNPVPFVDTGDERDARKFELLAFQVNDILTPKTNDRNTIEMQVKSFGETFHFMKNKRTKEKGFVSSHYMAEEGSLECFPWYFGKVGRGRAECFLAQECNINGTYLIRESDTKENSFALSCKVYKNDKFIFKHYHIQKQGELFFITAKQKFNSLPELADAVSKGSLAKINIKFSNMCQRPRPTTFNEIGAATGEWIIARGDVEYDRDGFIGGGQFGEVYKGKFRGTFDVAVKTLKSDVEGSDPSKAARAAKEFHAETEILMQLHHPHLVQVFGICNDASPFLMILEYLPKGSLKEYLMEYGEAKMTFEQLVSISENIASGMRCLEDKGIVHRDLAARNVMLDQWLQAKVGDFGLARQDSEYDTKSSKSAFPFKWSAIEAIKKRQFSHKSDVWSFGVVLWEMFTFANTPYPHLTNRDILGELDRGYRLPMPDYPSADRKKLDVVYNIMLLCWRREPETRPSFHALFDDFRDFETTIESKYDYSPNEFMDSHSMNSNASRSNTPRKKKGSGFPNKTRKISGTSPSSSGMSRSSPSAGVARSTSSGGQRIRKK